MPTGSAPISAADPARPLEAAEFAAAMDRLGQFGAAPELAVAVSGGPDSLALLLLLAAWTAARGGRLVALTVDHRLRPESGEEAATVARLCRSRGLEHHVLPWLGPYPSGAVQAAARDARYRLLEEFCRARGLLHLCLAHHRDDQAETLLMRLAAGSDLEGLAAMAARRRLGELLLLRPLLAVPKARLVETVAAAAVPWVEDPSNRNLRALRVAARRLVPLLAGAGLGPEKLFEITTVFGRLRAWSDRAVASLLAAAAMPDPAGFLLLDPKPLAAAPWPLARKALARILLTVGGRGYPPSPAAVERLLRRLLEGEAGPRTLGGCRLLAHRGRHLVVRELRGPPRLPLAPGRSLLWDGRYLLHLAAEAPARPGLWVAPLGEAGWRALAGSLPERSKQRIPAAARRVLPALFDLDGPAAVPHLNYYRYATLSEWLRCRYRPRHPLTDVPFTGAAE